MYFYVDESGHTGGNLFDKSQPTLYYGVLSSPGDLDLIAGKVVKSLRTKFDVPRLHASQLGNGKLVTISDEILSLQKNFDLKFDLYVVHKTDHAVISFFDQVFDQGLNPAVSWTGYWTPIRYVLLLKLAYLFDKESVEKAWNARIELDGNTANTLIIEICQTLRGRVQILPDARSRQLITDALLWTESNPEKIHYNVRSKKEILDITPNIIGFQYVISGIARRLKEKGGIEASAIVVDQQAQFNKAQNTLSEFYSRVKDIKPYYGPGMPEIDLSNSPTIPISFLNGASSVGLELVDLYLWIFRRYCEKKSLAPQLLQIVESQFEIGLYEELSLNGIERRWEKWFRNLPEPTEEQMVKARKLLEEEEFHRLKALQELQKPDPKRPT